MLRTFGAIGMSINKEFEKKEIRLLASKLDGTSMADSFVVSNKWSRLIYPKKGKEVIKKALHNLNF